MKQTLIYLLLFATVMGACKQPKKNLLARKWRAVKLENPEMDSFFIKSQAYIDTIGKGHDDATNIQLYGVANMDSMRHILQMQYDSAKQMQTNAVVNTVFNFRTDSVAVLSFDGAVDSSKWFFDDAGALILQDLNAGSAEKIKMEIITLSERELKLKFEENQATSTVTFQPEGK